MGWSDWIGRFFGPASETRAEPPEEPRAEEAQAGTSDAAPPASVADPLAILRGLTTPEAVRRALDAIDAAPTAPQSSALLVWLRRIAGDPAITADAGVRLSDFFAARGEVELASTALGPFLACGDAVMLAAMMRLADLAQQSGDTATVTRLYEEILAIDIGYPGVRERLARRSAPLRTGDAGATLVSPEAAQLARGRLELMRELGRGAAGAVFLARDARLGREVAVKIYHPVQRADRGARLRAEARIAASLASRHVVRVYELLEELGGLTMEYCPGGALRGAIVRGTTPVEVRRAWTRGVAHALAVAHDRGWVHRDLKPGNVLLRADGEPVLTDFGLARRIGAPIEPHEGTPGFVAPEVRTRLEADPRLDVYAFGALARELVGEGDPVLGPILLRALSADPDVRPRDGAALLRALESVGLAA
jgi:serine/threonine-protein kinase